MSKQALFVLVLAITCDRSDSKMTGNEERERERDGEQHAAAHGQHLITPMVPQSQYVNHCITH